ncbi:MAG: peptidase dimerization domain-containing protein, partial [Elusimicrobia bacterium]|nr:peptidase dimerization domain-containing protein [Elusimicrobiota bacterium]
AADGALYVVDDQSEKILRIRAESSGVEEIGNALGNLNLKAFGADYAFSLDGTSVSSLENEHFNADSASITIKGVSYHFGYAKNRMYNAARIAADIISSWPENMLPETTEGREGYVNFAACNSSVEDANITVFVRSFKMDELKRLEKLLTTITEEKRLKYPGAQITIKFSEGYRNMKDVIDKHPVVMKRLVAAYKAEGIEPSIIAVRGGFDASRLTLKGIPSLNIFDGTGNWHGPFEWVSVQGMEKSSKVCIAVLREWEKNS